MLEKTIEAHLVKRMKEIGGECYKWSSPGNRGVPDRICIFPNARVLFIEVKKPGQEPSKLQRLVGNRLIGLDQVWTWVDSKKDVDSLIKTYAQ